jgi:LysM repeat protein
MGAFLAKTLFILLLAAAIFGTAAYFTWDLFIRPERELIAEKNAPATPPPPDPALPEFKKAMETLKGDDLLLAREVFTRFVDRNPHSKLVDEAKDHLGKINTDIFLTPRPAPEKQVYVVRPNDVLNRVARITKTTPELLMRANNLSGTMLRIGQQLYYTPAEFSLVISKKDKKVTVLNHGKFFKHYPIKSFPASHAAKKGASSSPKLQGKIAEKIAWGPSGSRVIFSDKEYSEASFWISHTVAGHTLYSDPDSDSPMKATKPPAGGIGIEPEAAAELAVLLAKGDPVIVEN